MSEIEEQFINAFVQPNRRPRLLKMLADGKKRSKLQARLPHSRDFRQAYMEQIPRGQQSSGSIYTLLRSFGAPENCHVISENNELDGKPMPLETALDETVGFDLATIIICIPGKLGYFEDEGMHQRFILRKSN